MFALGLAAETPLDQSVSFTVWQGKTLNLNTTMDIGSDLSNASRQ
jgi:hypothetical protein